MSISGVAITSIYK